MAYVEIDLDNFGDDELIDALKERGVVGFDGMGAVLLNTIYEKRRVGKEYQAELDELIYKILGRIA